jgi:hypothetical protein
MDDGPRVGDCARGVVRLIHHLGHRPRHHGGKPQQVAGDDPY